MFYIKTSSITNKKCTQICYRLSFLTGLSPFILYHLTVWFVFNQTSSVDSKVAMSHQGLISLRDMVLWLKCSLL